MPEDTAVAAFLMAFNDVHGAEYEIAGRPDRVNRTTRDVDAWAQCADRQPLAIEHTVLPTFEGAYQTGSVFVRFVWPLEARLGGQFHGMFQVLVPDEALQTGVDWEHLAGAIEAWFLENAGGSPPGLTRFSLPGLPGEFTLKRFATDGLDVVYMARQVPQGDFDQMLRTSIASRLDHKYDELAAYQADGATTALVLESHDWSLINEQILAAAVDDVLRDQPHPGLDEVWFVWSIGSTAYVYCLVGSDEIRALAQERTQRIILDGA